MGPRLVLVADDQPEVRAWLADLLRSKGRTPVEAEDAERALELVQELSGRLSLVILDLDFGAGRTDGLSALRRLREAGHGVPVLILTGKGSVRAAVEALRAGATDFLEKNAHVEDTLAAALSRLESYEAVLAENRRLREELGAERAIVGGTPAIRAVLHQVERLGPIPRPVLICGERGTGKELVARALHDRSPRASGPFITVNCAAIPDGLLECELFGQEENAYTGAPFKEGRFDLAHRGTLFLDEVGNMGPDFQRKVLRVIEYQSFERVQGTKTISVDVRIVAATNTDLGEAIERGQFRADLYDRLAFDTIRVPPLRERADDIGILAEHFARRFHQEVASTSLLRFNPGAVAAMREYSWPGNVRELKSFVERLATMLDGPVVTAEDVRVHLLPHPVAREISLAAGTGGLEERVSRYEAALLRDALAASGGNRRRAAERLQLSYDQIRRLIAKHGIEVSDN